MMRGELEVADGRIWSQQDRSTPSQAAGSYIDEFVADHDRAREIDVRLASSLEEQSGRGLAAGTAICWRMRAIQRRVKLHVVHRQLADDFLMHHLRFFARDEAAANPRLVANEYEEVAEGTEL